MERRTYTISLLGDIMLGRLIDQLLPDNVYEPEEARHVADIRRHNPDLREYGVHSPWGNTLPLLAQSDLVLGNLETSATTSEEKWPDKVFNYRMHPRNVECLKAAQVDYVSLANNHTLDFGLNGLLETVQVVRGAGIACAGAGLTPSEAKFPAVLRLPKSSGANDEGHQQHEIHLYSFSDHPSEWQKIPEFNFINYTATDRSRIKTILTQRHPGLAENPRIKVVSMHWGPNYSWEPSQKIIDLAHFMIDECDVHIIHGHSSHHIQGIEVYKGKLIVYGCGDFLDDYAVVPRFRNDLSAVWNVVVSECESSKLEVKRVEVFPTRIKLFRTNLIAAEEDDHEFVLNHVRDLSAKFRTAVRGELGLEGQIIVDVN